MRAQQQQFEARRKLQDEEAAQLDEQQAQIAKQNDGLEALTGVDQDPDRAAEPGDRRPGDLLAKGLTQLTRVLTPQRELARLQGSAARSRRRSPRTAARSPRSRSSGCGWSRRCARRRSPSCATSSSARSSCARSGAALIEQIAQLDLRAPVVGRGLRLDRRHAARRDPAGRAGDVHRAEGRAADRARPASRPMHIDQVHVGQEAGLRFSAFDARTTPEVDGPRDRGLGRRLRGPADRAALLLRGRDRARRGQARAARRRRRCCPACRSRPTSAPTTAARSATWSSR